MTRHWMQGCRDLSKQTTGLELELRVPSACESCTAMLGDLGWVLGPQCVSASEQKSGCGHEKPGSQGETVSGSGPNLGTSLPSAGCGHMQEARKEGYGGRWGTGHSRWGQERRGAYIQVRRGRELVSEQKTEEQSQIWVQVLVLPLTSYVTVGKSLTCPGINVCHTGWDGGLNKIPGVDLLLACNVL